MIVYHGSDTVVKKPDILHSKAHLDFGKGFYVTSFKSQAERWAKRKAVINRRETCVISVFEMAELSGFKVMDFGDNLDKWLDFVCDCRNGKDIFTEYDVVKGKVANDKVFRVVDMYKRGIWDKVRAIQEIRVYETYDQLAFITQQSIDSVLTFKESIEVEL